MSLRYAPSQNRIYTKQELAEIFGDQDKDLDVYANAATAVLANPTEPIENIIKSLQIVLQDLQLRKDRIEEQARQPTG